MSKKRVHDPELEAVVQRALGLRITLTELCEGTNVPRSVLWRWRHHVSPRFVDRQAFIESAERMCAERMAEYSGL